MIQRIPCGSCIDCRLSYAKDWAFRCVCESKLYSENTCWFVTITYDDLHLPKPLSILSHETGRITDFYPLRKLDIQNFNKSLRKRFSNVRFYACGEYGDKNKRPHFHMIIFNLPLYDLLVNESFSRSRISEIECHTLYESGELNDCWRDRHGNLKGMIAVAPFSYDTACYVARYCMKKLKGESWKEFNRQYSCFDKDTGEKLDFPREFVLMSNRPGIGAEYFKKRLSSMYSTDQITLWYNNAVHSQKLPRYADTLLERAGYDLTDLKQIREEVAKSAFKLKLADAKMSEVSFLSMRNELLSSRSKRLVRSL